MAQMESPEKSLNSATNATAEDDAALRQRLLSRIAVAGVVIIGLLGGLAVYDSLNKLQAPAMPKMATAPADPIAPAVQEKPAADQPAEAAQVDAEPEAKTAAVEAEPERTETPVAPQPPEKPLKAAKPVTPQATARQATARPSEPAAAAMRPNTQREIGRIAPERSAPPHAPASRPLAHAAESAHRFLVQVGVFSNQANAEELVGKLQTAGIPAQIESHVQVGPFASRAEVERARAKLKEMGIDDGLLVRR